MIWCCSQEHFGIIEKYLARQQYVEVLTGIMLERNTILSLDLIFVPLFSGCCAIIWTNCSIKSFYFTLSG